MFLALWRILSLLTLHEHKMAHCCVRVFLGFSKVRKPELGIKPRVFSFGFQKWVFLVSSASVFCSLTVLCGPAHYTLSWLWVSSALFCLCVIPNLSFTVTLHMASDPEPGYDQLPTTYLPLSSSWRRDSRPVTLPCQSVPDHPVSSPFFPIYHSCLLISQLDRNSHKIMHQQEGHHYNFCSPDSLPLFRPQNTHRHLNWMFQNSKRTAAIVALSSFLRPLLALSLVLSPGYHLYMGSDIKLRLSGGKQAPLC